MSLPYFYINNISDAAIISLPEETSKHCIQVLRMKAGEPLQLTDGKGSLLTTRITQADKENCAVRVKRKYYQPPSDKRICIAISLLKNTSRFEWFLEKATEIGVSEIIPLICERTEKQHLRFERMQNILIASMLQSQQCWLPLLQNPQPFNEIVIASIYSQKLIAHCEAITEKKTLNYYRRKKEVQILIGPEGDFTVEEIELATKQGYQEVALGNTRLRSETAGMVAAALLINR